MKPSDPISLTRPLRVCHVINNLAVGGAETMLRKLIQGLPQDRYESSVISLVGHGEISRQLQSQGIPVEALGCGRSFSSSLAMPLAVSRLANRLKMYRPDVVQSWMYHSNLLASLATYHAGLRSPVVWNIRTARLDHHHHLLTRYIGKLGAWMSSRWPAAVVVNSESGRKFHGQFGFDAQRLRTIPNSFDSETFRPDKRIKAAVRSDLGIDRRSIVLGLVGSFQPLKGFQYFAQAAGKLADEFPHAEFILCGRNVDWENTTLQGWLAESGCPERFHLLGERNDVARVMASFDIAVSASTLEGFPNVVGEAMATGLPCVVTDVGDSARLVADTGVVVPPNDVAGLTAGCRRVLAMSADQRRELGAAARRRVRTHFNTARIVSMYEQLWCEAAQHVAQACAGVPRILPNTA